MGDFNQNPGKLRYPGNRDIPFSVYSINEGAADRILNVEGKIFFVQSSKLVEVSEYFRAMFTSFKESSETEIQIKEVDPEKFQLFLDAIFNRTKFTVTEGNMRVLVELSVFFQSHSFLIDFFEVKRVCRLIQVDTLLEYSERYGNLELIKYLDEFLVTEFVSLNRFEISATYFDLIQKFNLNKLLAAIIEKTLKTLHYSDYELIIKCLEYAVKYDFVSFKESIENFLADEIKKTHGKIIIKKYLEFTDEFKLEKLKGSIEKFLMEKMSDRDPTLTELHEYLKLTRGYHMQELKAFFEDIVICKFAKEKNLAQEHIDYEIYMDFGKKEGFKKLQKLLEDHLIESIPITEHRKLFSLAGKYNLVTLKKTLCDFFADAVVDYSKEDLVKLCEIIQEHKLKEVKTAINEKLCLQFANDPQLDFLETALRFDMTDLKNAMKSFFGSLKLDSPFIQLNKTKILALSSHPQAWIFRCMLENS